ncbi:MAG: hypothetical protein U5R31_17220 [Acidimicrobiia bacterium]|nr:hypothetical protein [Acidimicrobiia bacterium]
MGTDERRIRGGAVTVLVLLALVAAACSGDDTSSSGTTAAADVGSGRHRLRRLPGRWCRGRGPRRGPRGDGQAGLPRRHLASRSSPSTVAIRSWR